MPLLLYTFAMIMDFNLLFKKKIKILYTVYYQLSVSILLGENKAKNVFIHILHPPRILPSMSEFMAKYSSSVLKCRAATRVDTIQDERKA